MLLKIITWGIPLLIAVILHEVAHAWVADKLGDPTSRLLGRISLNPIVHIDPVMTILVPGFLILTGAPFIFGGAKPVPINPLRFADPRRGMAMVALAGPLTNFTLAALISPFIKILSSSPELFVAYPRTMDIVGAILVQSVVINVVLGVFNLIPIPPLDGGRIVVGYLPDELAATYSKIEPYGFLIIILMLSSGMISTILGPSVNTLLKFFLGNL